MAYVLPTFNLTINVWHYATYFGNFPTVIPTPDFTVAANLALGRRINQAFNQNMWLLLPPLTDIRDGIKNVPLTPHGDYVEVPAGSGRYYAVLEVDDIGKGFANEHRCAVIEFNKTSFPTLPDWPEPYP
jgi:hypothetical protein